MCYYLKICNVVLPYFCERKIDSKQLISEEKLFNACYIFYLAVIYLKFKINFYINGFMYALDAWIRLNFEILSLEDSISQPTIFTRKMIPYILPPKLLLLDKILNATSKDNTKSRRKVCACFVN